MKNKNYSMIYADPPWMYGKRRKGGTRFGGGAEGHYPLMEMEDIYSLPVQKMAADNCALFLWVTFPKLQEGIECMRRWGFEYKTVAFTWVKTNKKNEKPFFGVGYYTKSNAEICLLGIRGKMKPISNYVSSVLITPLSRHSEKPAEVRVRIVELFGDLPKIELFAREKVEGWDNWGNECLNH